MELSANGSSSTRRPLLAALAAVGVLTWACLSQAAARTGGTFVYALDDAYIHLTLAKNLAASGTWGLNPGEFAAASSSPLWTVTLAGLIRVFGPQPLLPLCLNLLLVPVALALAAGLLRDFGVRGPLLFLCLVGFALATPLPALVAGGMEHLLQVCLCVAYLRLLLRALDEPAPRGAGALTAWAVVSLLLPVTRYEDLFLIAAAAAVLAWRRRWAWVLLTLTPAALSVCGFGSWFLSQGGGFLPNTLLIKGQTGVLDALVHPEKLPAVLLKSLFAATTPTHVFVLVTALLAAALWRTPPRRVRLACVVVLVAFLTHAALAQTGWFFRYEAYLVALSLLCLAAAVPWETMRTEEGRRPGLAVAVLAAFVSLPVAARAVEAYLAVPAACGNIHDQQMQLAAFFRDNYDGEAVALNDVGAVGFGTDARVLDLYGLGNNEIAGLKRSGRYSSADMDRIARQRGVKAVAVYDVWFTRQSAIPADWIRVGTWTIADNYICASDTVTFYALDEAGAARLRSSLEKYRDRLPPGVEARCTPPEPTERRAAAR